MVRRHNIKLCPRQNTPQTTATTIASQDVFIGGFEVEAFQTIREDTISIHKKESFMSNLDFDLKAIIIFIHLVSNYITKLDQRSSSECITNEATFIIEQINSNFILSKIKSINYN